MYPPCALIGTAKVTSLQCLLGVTAPTSLIYLRATILLSFWIVVTIVSFIFQMSFGLWAFTDKIVWRFENRTLPVICCHATFLDIFF